MPPDIPNLYLWWHFLRRCKDRSIINTNTQKVLMFKVRVIAVTKPGAWPLYVHLRRILCLGPFFPYFKGNNAAVTVQCIYHLRVEKGLLNACSPPDNCLTQFWWRIIRVGEGSWIASAYFVFAGLSGESGARPQRRHSLSSSPPPPVLEPSRA